MQGAGEARGRDEDFWFLNTWATIRRSSASGADGVSIIEHRLPFGDSPPLHVHDDEDEIFHVLEGRMRFRLGEREVTAGPGETVVAPRRKPHSYRVETVEGARCLTITTGDAFESLVRAVSRPAGAKALPEASTPTPDMVEALARAAANNRIAIVGPPLA